MPGRSAAFQLERLAGLVVHAVGLSLVARSIAQLAVPGFGAARLRILGHASLWFFTARRQGSGNQQDGEDARDDLAHAEVDDTWGASGPGNVRTARRIQVRDSRLRRADVSFAELFRLAIRQ